MDQRARIFIRRVLLLHALALVAVILIVGVAARGVYEQARQQALANARKGQELLSEQTADGIETFYESIRNDLDLLHRADNDDPTTQPTTGAVAVAAPPAPLPPAMMHPIIPHPVPSPSAMPLVPGAYRNWYIENPGLQSVRSRFMEQMGALLWRQLQSRASLLYGVDAERLGKNEPPGSLQKNPLIRPIGPMGSYPYAKLMTEKMRDWLKGVERPSVSTFQDFGELGRGNIVGIPAMDRGTDRNRRLFVAFVPINQIGERFLEKLNKKQDQSMTATLADENMITMVSSDPSLVGINAAGVEDETVRALAKRAMQGDSAVTAEIEHFYRMGKAERHPRMMTMQPVNVLNKRWFLMVSSRLSDVDAVVNRLFSRALGWAVVVCVLMTGLLVSTSVWTIRGRLRNERLRHEVLTREINQAREIQLAWLPNRKLSVPRVDVAAINTPANHISGDFYNWFELPDGRLVVTIGDVTGHGMSAAFLMATTQLLVRATMMRIGEPGLCLEEVNRQLCSQIFVGQFVTMLILVIDQQEEQLQVATAGHYPPLSSDDEGCRPLPMEPQLVLGVDPESTYPTETFPLPRGSSLLLYTDGVLDVESPRGQRFRSDGLRSTLAGRFPHAQALLDQVIRAIDSFRGKTDLPDDLTLVAIRLDARAAARKPLPLGA